MTTSYPESRDVVPRSRVKECAQLRSYSMSQFTALIMSDARYQIRINPSKCPKEPSVEENLIPRRRDAEQAEPTVSGRGHLDG